MQKSISQQLILQKQEKNNNMRKIIITIILFIVSNLMYSQDSDDFQYVAAAENGSMVYVLFEKENYGTKEFWQKMTYPLKTIKGKSGKLTKSGGGYSLQYIKMNCAEKEYSSTDIIIYDRNGKSKNRPEYYDQHNAKVIPGSVMSAVHRYM